MKTVWHCALLLFMGFSSFLEAQVVDLSGKWTGFITIDGRTDTFWYELTLEQDRRMISGLSFCFLKDTSSYARFNMTGVVEQDGFIFQEIQQYEPQQDKWCHKYMILKRAVEDRREILTGRWKATNCPSGDVVLTRRLPGTAEEKKVEEQAGTKELPFTVEGKWTGLLQQEDRETLFRFEVDLQKNNQGTSNIFSDQGGQATMQLVWNWGLVNNAFRIVESGVINKTDPDWPWCIKTAELQMRREGDRYVLEGAWKGYIEGYDYTTGPCASGTLRLEKPVRTQPEIVQKTPEPPKPQEPPEPEERPRKVRIQKIVEVASKNLRLRAWDSGTVDGDVITIFLNGEQVLFRHRVDKRKYAFPITLQEDYNFMVMYADDIGDIVPNTVAVSIDDGEKEQLIVLSSDLEESGAVLLKQIKITEGR